MKPVITAFFQALILCIFCFIVSLLMVWSKAHAGVVIQSAPQSVEASIGQTVTFTVNATSNRTMRYIWYKNNVTIDSAKTKTLTMKVSENSAATYRCTVTDGKTKAYCPEFKVTIKAAVIDRDVEITWTRPLQRANGNDLPESEIASYTVYEIKNEVESKIETVPKASLKFTVKDAPLGFHTYGVRATDTKGLNSSLSDKVTVEIKP